MIIIPCTFAYLWYWEKIKDAESHLRHGNNFPLNCSLAPPTRATETTSETEAVISNLYPTSKYKSKLVVWDNITLNIEKTNAYLSSKIDTVRKNCGRKAAAKRGNTSNVFT